MRGSAARVVVVSFAQDDRRHQTRHTRQNVHHSTTGEIECAERLEPAVVAPHPVSHGIVARGRPDQNEDHVRNQLHPSDDGAGDECRRDDGEGALIGSVCEQWIAGRVTGVSGWFESEHSPIERAEAGTDRRTEGEREADENPLDEDDAHADEGKKELVENVLVVDEATVEEGESRCHQKNQSRGCHHPSVVPGVMRVAGGTHRSCSRRVSAQFVVDFSLKISRVRLIGNEISHC